MARGGPDYNIVEYSQAVNQVDVTLLIAALKGIAPLTGTGKYLLFDTFDCGLSGWELDAGDGVIPYLDYTKAHVSPVSMLLQGSRSPTPTFPSAARSFGMPSFGRFGFEFSILEVGAGEELTVKMPSAFSSVLYDARLKLSTDVQGVSVWSGGAWVAIQKLPVVTASRGWITVKIIVDYVTGLYDKIIYENAVYPLGIAIPSSATLATYGYTSCKFMNDDSALVGADVNIGYAIVTSDEP